MQKSIFFCLARERVKKRKQKEEKKRQKKKNQKALQNGKLAATYIPSSLPN